MQALVRANNSSPTWKGIIKQADVLEKRLGSTVLNGKSVFFWLDKWLGNFVLWDLKTRDVDENVKFRKVADYWDHYQWRWTGF